MNRNMFAVCIALSGVFAAPIVCNPARAQQNPDSFSTPRIDGFDVQSVTQAAAGRELPFSLYGSPGGVAAVQIVGATGAVALVETEAGVYEGTYTIRSRDKITAASTATANLRLGNRVASVILDEPLVGRAPARRRGGISSADGVPRIDRFDIDPGPRLAPGEEVRLTLMGTQGGKASARIIGVRGKLVLEEVRAGVYESAYVIKNRDRIASDAVVTGNLRIGDRETSMVLGKSLLTGSENQSNPPRPKRVDQRVAAACSNCGIVEAVNVVEVKGEGSYLGKIAGGLAGVLLGSQVGSGRGTTAAEVAGAVGGAYAGNEVEKRVKTTRHFELVVRLENGGMQTFSYAAQPAFVVGTKVKVENGALVPG